MEFNVDFEPFIDNRVPRIQSGQLIQCPIKAPTRKYDVIWACDQNRVFGFKTKTSFFYSIGPDPCKIYTCNLIMNDRVLLSSTVNYMSSTEDSSEFDMASVCIGSICSCCMMANFHLMVYFFKKWRKGSIENKECADWLEYILSRWRNKEEVK
jgi:hypothetical protein